MSEPKGLNHYDHEMFCPSSAYEKLTLGLLYAQEFHCLYTNKLLELHHCQIDHLFPLKAAWDLGADRWPMWRRKDFGTDILNLVVCTIHANESKGDSLTWRPQFNVPMYEQRLQEVADRYALKLPAQLDLPLAAGS